jgi:hypothetical protein
VAPTLIVAAAWLASAVTATMAVGRRPDRRRDGVQADAAGQAEHLDLMSRKARTLVIRSRRSAGHVSATSRHWTAAFCSNSAGHPMQSIESLSALAGLLPNDATGVGVAAPWE